MRKSLLVVLAYAVLLTGLFAQPKSAEANEPSRASRQSPEMAKLSQLFVGNWSGQLREGDAKASPLSATQNVQPGPAGNSLIQDFHAGSGPDSVTGHGVLWWDSTAGVYRALWCDSDLPSGCRNPTSGNWNGQDLVLSQQREVKGHRLNARATYTDIKPDSFTFLFDLQTDDAPPERLLTVSYRRIKP